jgi:LPS O-antigen subunit length determinant protein (WzzB/FepE family)
VALAAGRFAALGWLIVARRRYTAEQVDAAVEALGDASRFAHAQEIVTHAAPNLQRVLTQALAEGDWFGSAHEAHVAQAALQEDADERLRAVRTLVAEETRLGMLVGVAVGFELARELSQSTTQED